MDRCPLCKNLEAKYYVISNFTPDQLEESADKKQCIPCAIIFQAILQAEARATGKWKFATDISRAEIYFSGMFDDTLTAHLNFKYDRPKIILEIFHSEGGTGKRPWDVIKSKPSIKGHPLQDESLAWVRALLANCLDNHPSCPSADEAILPRRILVLQGEPDGSNTITVRLQEQQLPTKARFATLSHCWGDHQTCVTTSSTLVSRKNDIPWDEIPRTFQDSIRYCLALRIQYIWIDALCIIQDDPDDWQVESAKMADIYQNSYITLAATASASDMGGCYPEELNTSDIEYSLHCTNLPTDCPPLLVRHVPRHLHESGGGTFPLLTRGWVFQERFLSPRMLHFCGQDQIWECASHTECECGGPRTDWLKDDLERLRQAMIQAHDLTTPSHLYLTKLSQIWHHAVQQYSDLLLTKPSDRFPALSGIAERISPSLQPYRAGLWDATLPSDLLWYVIGLTSTAARPASYIAPSWSWASVTSPVKYRSYWSPSLTDPKFQVLSCTTPVPGKNPFGAVSVSHLTVQAKTFPAVLQHTSHPFKYEIWVQHRAWPGGVRLHFCADYVLSAGEGSACVVDQAAVLLLKVGVYRVLVLREVAGDGGGGGMSGVVYERIGLFHLSDWTKMEMEMEMETEMEMEMLEVTIV